MKKKSILVTCITFLVLVTLVLLGCTYAYFRARIIGNESTDPSISAQSKKMEIVYEDGTSEMNMTGKIEPGFEASKTFYVKNTGNDNVIYSIVLENINNTFERNQDWQWTLTENGEKVAEGILAAGTHQILVEKREIAEVNGTENVYVLTLNYENSDDDQSLDMGKKLSFKVNIFEEQFTWNNSLEGTLLYMLKANQPNSDNAKVITTEDDYGISYVYQGDIINNYVNYSGKCFRVLRVQGDGTIKLVLADNNGLCDANTYSVNNYDTAFISTSPWTELGYDTGDSLEEGCYLFSVESMSFMDSFVREELELWRDENLDVSKLTTTDTCIDNSISNIYGSMDIDTDEDEFDTKLVYGSNNRIESNLRCNFSGKNNSVAERYNNNISLLTVDEINLAKNYLITNASNDAYWTMTPESFTYLKETEQGCPKMYVNQVGDGLISKSVNENAYIRPVVVLKSDVLAEAKDVSIYGQVGTSSNPYIIK